MKKLNTFCAIAIILFMFVVGTAAANAKTLYDDFSGDYLDSTKWKNQEFVREVVDGKLVSKITTESGQGRNRTTFKDPGLIYAIEAEVAVVNSVLENDSAMAEARIDGHFYNTLSSGDGIKGNVYATVRIKDNGNGLEGDYVIVEFLDDNAETYNIPAEGTISTGLSYSQSYKLKVEYDNASNKFTFTLGNDSVIVDNAYLPAYSREPVQQSCNLVTGINNAESGVNFIHALFDNVYINNEATVYDDFSTAPLDQTKWKNVEFVRAIENGKLRLTSHSTGDRQNAGINFAEIHPYTEATVTIKSDSQLEPGEKGIARIDGYFYNDTYGPGSWNGYEGNVWVGFVIEYNSDGTLVAKCSGDRTLDAAETQWEYLFFREFHVPIVFDRAYKLSIHFTGSQLRFSCQDTVTGREDLLRYNITTAVYKPYDEYRSLLSRVNGNAAGGYMAVEFDDVYVDVAQPPATYDATGDWEITGSNPWADLECEIPEVGDTSNITITQDGNSFTMVVHGDEGDLAYDGVAYGESYQFLSDVEIEGDREVNYGVFHLSQSTLGTGSVTSHFWADGIYQCRSGFNISVAKLADTDGDGIPDIDDTDDDNDGVLDVDDDFPLDDSETTDTDQDGIGNNADTDDDNDGVSDEEESSGPNSGDANNDGTQDSLQSNVASLNVNDDQDYVVLESTDGTKITECQVSDTPSNAPTSAVFDYGLFEFTLSGLTTGGTTTVTLTFPADALDFDTYYKFGPTADNVTPHWYEFKYDSTTETGAKIDNTINTITLYFKDGARGDDDLTANGIAVDIGGPARTVDDDGDGDGGGSGGCFISIMNQ